MSIVTPEQHGLKAHSDGGWDDSVPVQARNERFTSNVAAEYPDVSGHEIQWKLSPIALFRDLLDGELDGSAYQYLSAEGEGTLTDWVGPSDSRIGSAGAAEEKSSANAWGAIEHALTITVSGEQPAYASVSRSAFGASPRAAHTVITAKSNSTGLVVLRNAGEARLSENVEIVVEENARLTVVSVQEWADDAVHLASHFAQVGRNAFLRHIVVSLSGKVVRVNPSVHLSGDGADAELYGLYFADAGQHIEQRVYLHHKSTNTRGRVNYKGALQGDGARTVWVGDVLIGEGASGTDSYESNRNLVLTEGTRADSIPNLEIETGDIVGAGHASATGRFDDEQLFYLQARGITELEARRLVVLGFLSEIIQKIGDAELEEHLHAAVDAELARTTV
jgi:Fe-S cluster assembly protein SufD